MDTGSELKAVGHVTALQFYPVKSAAVLHVNHMTCYEAGPALPNLPFCDRQFAVLRPNGKVATLRDYARFTLIKPRLSGGEIHLEAPGMKALVLTESTGKGVPVTQFEILSQKGEGQDCGDEAAEWFSTFLNKSDLRLMCYNRETNPRDVKGAEMLLKGCNIDVPSENPKLSYQDVGPYTLMSNATVTDVNKRLDNPVSLLNFRPNICIDGLAPYAEDSFDKVKIGSAEFRGWCLDPRCSLPSVDPITAKRYPRNDPYRTLREFRPLVGENDPQLGIYMVLVKEGNINVGDVVYASNK